MRIEPLACFAEEAPPASVRSEGISLVAPDCFFQNREYETSLALERYRSRFVRHLSLLKRRVAVQWPLARVPPPAQLHRRVWRGATRLVHGPEPPVDRRRRRK